ncbi:MAG: hypothetical protein AAGE52_40655, partial [Myxococcota bacterium]
MRWLFVLASLSACTEPAFREVACDNGGDDDLDELVDCADPDCRELSDVCEITLDRCRDGRDSDRNGLVDCEDSTCREAGHCGPIEVDVCRPIDGDGCPVGYACYSS